MINLMPTNSWIILTYKEEKTTSSGIIVNNKNKIIEEYEVLRVGSKVTKVKEGDIVCIPQGINTSKEGFPEEWEGKKIKFIKEQDLLAQIIEK